MVSLVCRVTGVPTPTVTWFKDNNTVFNDNEDQSVLEFRELDLKDRGFYHCKAENLIDGEKVPVMSNIVILNIKSRIEYWQYLEALISITNYYRCSSI